MGWALVVFLWMIAASFIISGALIVMALVHNRKDHELVFILSVVLFGFAVFCAAAVYGALAVAKWL